ncbi:unnamed protein product [Agarophyton chilense]
MKKIDSPYRGLKVLPCKNPLYRKVLNYRYYRLKVKSKKRSGRETAKVKDHIKRLKIGHNDLRFDGKTPILVIEFLNRFVADGDTLEMSEPQEFGSLPNFLKGFALEQYRSVCGSLTADEGGDNSWTEAVQYLLRSYATSNAIHQAILDLRDVTQKPEEGKAEYSSRLNKASVRCGNVHSTEDKITLYIDGLDPSIKSLVARYREKHGRVSFLELVQFAKAEGDAARARGSPRRSVAFGTSMGKEKISARVNQRSKLLHLESPVDSRDSSFAPKESDSHEEAVHLMECTDSSVPTVDLPHSESQDEEALMAMEGRGPMCRPYKVPPQGGFKNGKPGWVVTPTEYRSQPMLTNRRDRLICYSCYGKHHLSAECTLPAKDLSRIMMNYEALSEEKRSRVPAGLYWKAKVGFLRHQCAGPTSQLLRMLKCYNQEPR